jgi:hypothetical protein
MKSIKPLPLLLFGMLLVTVGGFLKITDNALGLPLLYVGFVAEIAAAALFVKKHFNKNN